MHQVTRRSQVPINVPSSTGDVCAGGEWRTFCGSVDWVEHSFNDEMTSVKFSCSDCHVILYDDVSYGGKYYVYPIPAFHTSIEQVMIVVCKIMMLWLILIPVLIANESPEFCRL